jgi:hypothetical protein
MYVCMYMCMYILVFITVRKVIFLWYVCMYVYAYVWVYMYGFVLMLITLCKGVCLWYVCMYVCIMNIHTEMTHTYIHTCVTYMRYIYTRIHTYTHIHIHTHIHTYTHIHTHTYPRYIHPHTQIKIPRNRLEPTVLSDQFLFVTFLQVF